MSLPNERASRAISYHHISYQVQSKSKCCGSTTKIILKDMSGIFKPGMNAILGPTGSGKSSLLDVLAGRKDPKGLQGYVLVGGQKQPANFKCIAGYVVQDDVVMGTLTVRENLQFSANLRLPRSLTREHKSALVESTIKELGLEHCADTKVGTPYIRGVSGGERKRTNIGMELIISPSILFLDEPTTGLDANTANSVMLLLNEMGRKGKTIIFSIHQPRFSIYKLFNRLSLLCRGKTVYHGAADQALGYFKSIGLICEKHNNPPDFFLDVINGEYSATDCILHENGRHKDNCDATSITVCHDSEDRQTKQAKWLARLYKRSDWHRRCLKKSKKILNNFTNSKDEISTITARYELGFFSQLYHVSGRALKNLFRSPQASYMQLIVIILLALIIGVIYYDIPSNQTSGIQNRVGGFFFIVMNMMVVNMSAIELFIQERVIFIHENISGFYRISVYFIAKIFLDVLPMRTIPVIFFAIITYWMMGLTAEAGKFFFFLLNLGLTTFAAAGIGFAVSASVEIVAVANLLIALVIVFTMIFSGLLVNVSTVAGWLRWLQYLSIPRYSLNALCINEMKDLKLCVSVVDDISGNYSTICDPQAGRKYLQQQGIDHDTVWDLWKNEFALVCITLVLFLLTYVQLRRIKKLK